MACIIFFCGFSNCWFFAFSYNKLVNYVGETCSSSLSLSLSIFLTIGRVYSLGLLWIGIKWYGDVGWKVNDQLEWPLQWLQYLWFRNSCNSSIFPLHRSRFVGLFQLCCALTFPYRRCWWFSFLFSLAYWFFTLLKSCKFLWRCIKDLEYSLHAGKCLFRQRTTFLVLWV